MKTTIQLAIVGIILLTACKKNAPGIDQSLEPANSTASSTLNQRERSTIELVYFNSVMISTSLKLFPGKAFENIPENSKPINILYTYNGFVPVANAIQEESHSALWKEVRIFYLTKAHLQFYNDADILAAASGSDPKIVLLPAPNIYRGAISLDMQLH